MDDRLRRAVERCVARSTGRAARVVGGSSAGGGCINRAQVVDLDDGRRVFVKSNPDPLPRMFEGEVEGLLALGAPGVIRVPRPLGAGPTDDDPAGTVPYIVLEAIDAGSGGPSFFADFGRRLAELHRTTEAARYGFDHDNYLGSTPQPNAWADDWCDFWRRHRLGHQLHLARRRGRSDRALDRLGDRLLDRLDTWLADPAEPACLLHGDLWGGNYMIDEEGAPVLIDPAVYYGRREADLAMTHLFGGFDARFYAAYEEMCPLAPGSDERLEIYKLYHLLNHLNLFGGGYHGSCLSVLRRLVG